MFKKEDVGATCTGFVNIKKGSEEDLLNAVATVGPISVAIDAGHSSFQVNTYIIVPHTFYIPGYIPKNGPT